MNNKTASTVIYGVTDRRDIPWHEKLNDFLIDNTPLPAKEKSLFFNSLKLLVGSGIRVSQAIKMLSERARSERLQRVLATIHYDINERGMPLSSAMSKYPDFFNESEIKMIYSAEITGKLEEVLSYLAVQMDKNLKLSMQIKSAMVYPITVFGVIILSGFAMMIFVVPKFKEMFASLGAELPWETRALIATSEFVQSSWWILLTILVAAALFFKNWKDSPEGKIQWHKILLDTPIVSKFVRNFSTIQIATNFATLLEAGIPVSKAMQVLRQIVDNKVISEEIYSVEQRIVAGDQLSEGFKESPEIDPIIGEVIEIGEKSGAITEILQKTGTQYQLQFDADIKNLSKMLSPVILVIVSVAVIFMGLAILKPIFALQDAFTGA
ncbi:hypothetical protein CSB37_02115 [bacterium DOLZORAL124_38_8]|nr:MAG: hypothetical protein CSB37_02115 [bacterium DOLZORAL124_38_8]